MSFEDRRRYRKIRLCQRGQSPSDGFVVAILGRDTGVDLRGSTSRGFNPAGGTAFGEFGHDRTLQGVTA